MSPSTLPTIIDRFAPLARGYDVLLCDVWGVVHNGVAAFSAACEALTRFRAGGGTVILITNAPRPGAAVQRILDRFGVPHDAYDAITTSGDVTRGIVESRLSERVFHLGPRRDLPIFAGLEVTFAPPKTADYVVCSGLFDDAMETPENYSELLAAMRARSLFMVCANPDIVVERGDTLLYCAGALADAYVELGGEALYCGEPHAPIYEVALEIAAAQPGACNRRFDQNRSAGRGVVRRGLPVRHIRHPCRGIRRARGAGFVRCQRDVRRRRRRTESADA